MEEKEKKNESGNILAGQAGMEIVGLRKVMWAGTERYAAKGCCRLAPGGMERRPESIVLCKESLAGNAGRSSRNEGF